MSKVVEQLQAAAAKLKQERAGMSLRAVAARLEISPSYWSKILRGERQISQQLLPRIVKVLKFDVQQTAELQKKILQEIESQRYSPSTGLRTADQTKSPVADYKVMGESHHWLHTEWFYIPVLNAVTLTPAPNAAMISQRLKLSPRQTADALGRLTNAGLVQALADGTHQRTEMAIRFTTLRSEKVIRDFQARMIGLAQNELTSPHAGATVEGRHISSVCFAGDKQKLDEARLILEEALFKAANLMAESDQCGEIYQLNLQLFPLTK